MGYPVKITVDGFRIENQDIPKGDIYDARTETMADFIESQGNGKRQRGKPRGRPRGKYSTRQLKAGGPEITEEELSTDAPADVT